MRTGWARRTNLSVPIIAAAVVVVVATGWSARDNFDALDRTTLLTVVPFFVAIMVGEAARLTILTGRATAPMSTAAALALALSSLAPEGGQRIGAAVVVTTVSVAMILGNMILAAARRPVQWGHVAARVLGAAVAPLVFRHLTFDGRTLLSWQARWEDQRWLVAVVMLLVGSLAMLVDLTLQAVVRASDDHAPLLRSIVDEVRSGAALASALVASGALIALAEYAIRIAALPLFLFPLLLTYFGVQRYASIRTTYRQTIGALSSLTDRAGYTRLHHADRVTGISLAIGRDLGLSQRELTDLEYAALLHDLGQVALREPIPRGATVMAAPADQQRIAHDGAEIVRTTGVLDNVAAILEAQTTPYRQVREFGEDLPMSSRIIKVANAYDDLSQAAGADDDRAIERIHLGLGYEYDPKVVDSLTKILERRRRSASTST
jgi:hypothetical protein